MPRPSLRAVWIAALSVLVCAFVHAATPDYTEGGYADRTSVAAGGTISFRIASSVSPFSLQIVNLAQPTTVLATVGNLTSAPRDCSGLWESGCGWPVTATFTIPAEWPSGYYAAQFPTSGGTRSSIFVVRAASPGSTSSIVVISPTNTYTAYNQFSGKSVYDDLSTDHQRAHVVSFDRPYADGSGLGRYLLWEKQFVDWMTVEGRSFDVATDDDLADPSFLPHYKAVVILGHPEYWTLQARRNLESFSNAGGHVAIFGGNTMWWQARVDLQSRRFTCYKDAALDPMTGADDSLVTVNWYDAPVFNPENLITGISFRNAEYTNRVSSGSYDPLPNDQRTPYTVVDPASWVFSGTGVTKGQSIAQPAGGIEVDGAIFNIDSSGACIVDGSDGTPLNYSILATIPAEEGYGTIGFYVNSHGGAVFNAGTRDWSHGLTGDAVVQQMTRNVLDRFATGQPFDYQPRTVSYRTQDLFNVASPFAGVLPGWRGPLLNATLSSSAAYEGAYGLQLTGTKWTQLVRNFMPTNEPLPSAGVNLYINADQLVQTGFSLPLVALVDENSGSAQNVILEMQVLPQGKCIRVSNYSAGKRTGASNWIVLAPGWQPASMSWRSPGMTVLTVGTQQPVRIYNSTARQIVNAVMLQFPGSDNGFTGSVSIDELQVVDAVGPASPAESELSATPATIVADGTTTATITVRLEDAFDAELTSGGDTVVLSTTAGTLSAVSDNGDGTYTATLTSTATGVATISGRVNGAQMSATTTVNFVAGAPAVIAISAPASDSPGTPFDFDLTIRDATGNVVTSYVGTVHFSADDSAATLPADYTFQASDHGVHHFTRGATFRSLGTRTLTVSDVATPSLKGSADVAVRATTTTALSSSANPASPGSALTMTATVTPSTSGPPISGSVTFKDGSVTIGTATIASGVASFTTSGLSSGPHTITGEYSGDGNYTASTSASYTQYVTLAAPTVTAAATSTATASIIWSAVAGAAQYVVERSSNHGAYSSVAVVNAPTTSISDTSLAAGTSYLYRVRAIDAGANPGFTSIPAVATTIQLASPAGIVRAADFNDLRNAIDAFRLSAGLGAAAYTNAVAPGMLVKAVDLVEMRSAVQTARSTDGLPQFAFTDSVQAGATVIKAVHLRELQQAIGAFVP